MVQGKMLKSMLLLEWGGDFLVPTHRNLFGSQLFPEKPVLALSHRRGQTIAYSLSLSGTCLLCATTGHVASALTPTMAALYLCSSKVPILAFQFSKMF